MIGKEFPSEFKEYIDEKTGNVVKQLTSNGSNNFHFYFTDNSFCTGDQDIYFYRTVLLKDQKFIIFLK